MTRRQRLPTLIMAALLAVIAVALLAGGLWLALVGGSRYYVVAGVLFLVTAILLYRRKPEALAVYAALVTGTLIWALYEVGFDWWPLAARGDVVFVLGGLLLLPWVTRPLGRRSVADALDGREVSPTPLRGSGALLAGSLVVALAVAVTSWFVDLHRVEGALPGTRQAPGTGEGVPPGEWHAYGRTELGQRYSPLAEITPANLSQLEVAWQFETGDESQPGDPVETTFEVTPLKIGDRLFLCTPHQSVIALDATTGGEVWRYDPKIQGELALQHLTCRGLSYQPPSGTAQAPVPAAATAPGASATP